jgi:hypothetical protein
VRRAYREGSPLRVPVIFRKDGRNDVSDNLGFALHEAKDTVEFVVQRNEPGNGFAVFGDDDFLAPAMDLVDDGEAVGLELAQAWSLS